MMLQARPIRVLQVVQRFYPELGGLETHVAEVTGRLAAMSDIDVTILTTDRSGQLPAEEWINGVRVIRRRAWPKKRDYYFVPGLARVIRQGDWDVVHMQGGQTLVPLIGMLAAISARVPFVLTFHNGGYSTAGRSLLGAVRTKALTPLLSRAARLVAVSRFEKASFAADTGIDPDRFVVINNGGALPAVSAGVTPEPGTIVSSGRLEKYKGHHRAIEALPLVRRSVPAARLTILGSGPYEDELHALAARLGVTDQVTIRHLAPNQRGQMADLLAGSAVMAALSNYEAHPVGIMEALAIGLPVLGSDVAGIGDLVEDGLVTGVEVNAGPVEVADALIRMLGQTHADTLRTAPDFELPTWESCAAGLAEVYREVAKPFLSAPPLRIAQIIPTLTTGGAERQLQSVVAHSHNIHRTIALYGAGTVGDGMRAAGAPVNVLGMAGFRKALAIPRLARQLRRMRPDAVHVHLLAAQLWGIPAARLAGVPTIITTEHSLMDTTIENRPLTPMLGRIYRLLERMSTRTVAVSATTKSRLIRWGIPAERISVIDNGIDFATFAYCPSARNTIRAELNIAADSEVVGAVGRLEPVKRFPELLAALAPTLQKGKRELVLVGNGPLLATLQTLADRLSVADCVHLTGPRPDIPALLSAMDVLVSPSRDETFGMAVLEGLGAGLPVVYAQCPALDELGVQPAWAFELAKADSNETTEADSIRDLVGLALQSRLETRFQLPGLLAQTYGIGRTADALDDLYRQLVEDAPGRHRTAAGRT